MWKCPACQIEIDDNMQQCPLCGVAQTQPATNPEMSPAANPASDGKVTWSYSGKAFRARSISIWFLTLLFIGFGIYLMVSGKMGDYWMMIWGVILAVPAVLWLWFAGVYWYKTNFIRYRLAEAHLYYEHGLLRRTVDTMELIGVADLRMQQTLWDRFINGGIGTVEVFSVADKTDETLKMVGLENPQEVLEKIDNARRRLRGRGIVQM